VLPKAYCQLLNLNSNPAFGPCHEVAKLDHGSMEVAFISDR
jgi:hypothetical protein